ncbi:hypothetical protein BHM03_00057595 [Ensete ventricosum]|nr:hypothetical protein BHM03_00057595 [Ensete ventricosum]
MGSHTNTVSRKNAKVINFVRSHMQSQILIGFSCTVSEIQNTGHSKRNSPLSRTDVAQPQHLRFVNRSLLFLACTYVW